MRQVVCIEKMLSYIFEIKWIEQIRSNLWAHKFDFSTKDQELQQNFRVYNAVHHL